MAFVQAEPDSSCGLWVCQQYYHPQNLGQLLLRRGGRSRSADHRQRLRLAVKNIGQGRHLHRCVRASKDVGMQTSDGRSTCIFLDLLDCVSTAREARVLRRRDSQRCPRSMNCEGKSRRSLHNSKLFQLRLTQQLGVAVVLAHPAATAKYMHTAQTTQPMRGILACPCTSRA